MGSDAKADVIILSWNRVADTIAAIDSALRQQGVAKRVWVVDQGSAPDQLAELQAWVWQHPDVHLQALGINLGVAGGRNVASRLGSAPYIVALDNDAVFGDVDALARATRHLDASPELGAIAFRILNYFTMEDDESSWGYPPLLRPRSREEFYTTRFVGAGHAIRRTAFEAAGGYDEALFFFLEEIDLCYRMLNLGYHIKYVPDVSILHKVSPERRVEWSEGRYYYATRNRLYMHYKYGTPLPKIVAAAAVWVLRGARNGLLGQALRSVRDAIRMSYRFARSRPDKSLHRLSRDTKLYIRKHDLKDQLTLRDRIRGNLLGRLQ